MPTYEYECDACGHKFEKYQSITAAPIRKCPICGKSKVRRLIGTGGGLIFKGSGFYTTDYRSEAYKSAAKADTAARSESASTASSSGGEKSAGKDSKTSATPAKTTKPPPAPKAKS